MTSRLQPLENVPAELQPIMEMAKASMVEYVSAGRSI